MNSELACQLDGHAKKELQDQTEKRALQQLGVPALTLEPSRLGCLAFSGVKRKNKIKNAISALIGTIAA